MAGWSIYGNGAALDYLEILQSLQNNGVCLDLDVTSLKMSNDGGKDGKLRDMFDNILSVFLKEFCVSESIRPLPAMLGDGKCVDLFKLFWVVREKGGYDFVSKYSLWGLVAEEIGLDSGVTSSVKLFYFKYLDLLDRWVRSFLRDKGIGRGIGVSECNGNLGLLPVGLKTQFKNILCNVSDHCRINEECSMFDSEKYDNQVSPSNDLHNTNEVAGVTELGIVEKCVVDDDKDVVILDKSVVKEEVYSRKRKRETLSGMLNWLTEIAKNPRDTAFGKLAEAYKQTEYGGQEFRCLVLLARTAVLESLNIYWTEEKDSPLWQKKQKMHPSMYEDQVTVDHMSTERQRCSPMILPHRNGQLDSCHELSDLDISATSPAGIENDQSLNPFDDGQLRKRVSIGPLFQAEVPEWTDMVVENDPKWLGTQHWPMITGKHNSLAQGGPIGQGRQDSCDCRVPGSVECVRFHIAEKKMRLKSELGLVFYTWRFHYMGEEVSLSWTEEEEKKFMATVRLNPRSLGKFFWKQLCRCFRTKSRKNLVSYYYNVFVLRRRTYQNRVTPCKIDSDDDESEFGSLSNGFGHEAVRVPGFRSIPCAQSYQCTDLDMKIPNPDSS